ncbi:hypothetical protein Tco_1168927, partial [Tanacetum coccineum]
MDDYTREMMDLKTLVTRTLEKKGVLAKIRCVLVRDDMLVALLWSLGGISFRDLIDFIFLILLAIVDKAELREACSKLNRGKRIRNLKRSKDCTPALLCTDSYDSGISQLHASASAGPSITALICVKYLDLAQSDTPLQSVFARQKDAWKAELRDFSNKNGYDINRNGDSGPLLLDVLEGFLKFENQSQGRGSGRRSTTPEQDSRRPSSSSVAGGLAPLGRQGSGSQGSDRRGGSSNSSYRNNDDYNWRYENDDTSEDITRASIALENLQLDRKARNLTTSWR